MTELCFTNHAPSDPIAQALMLMPNGGPQVRIKVGRDDYRIHHWQLKAIAGEDSLIASWQRWQDIEFMPATNWYRALLHRLRRITRVVI